MSPSIPERNQPMWRTTRTLCAITASTFLLAAVISVAMGKSPVEHLSIAIFSGLLGLAMRKERPGVGIAIPNFIFLLLVTIGQVVMWNSNEHIVHTEKIFEIFTGYRITALVIGLLAPPVQWLGWVVIATTGVVPILHFYSWSPLLRAQIGLQEPWMTLMYVTVSGILYSFRSNQLRIERKSASLQQRVEMLQRFTHIVVNTQHHINTPLQTIENSVSAIRKKDPELSSTLTLIDRSINRIRNVMNMFSLADTNRVWKEEIAPVSSEEFEKLIHELNP